MSVPKELVAALKKQLAEVEKDLRTISEDEANPWARQLREEYERARTVRRTALTWSQWRDGEVSLAGVAWVLASVFVRFCEDNGLIDRPWISGPDGRLLEAADAEAEFYRQDPSRNTRDWLRAAFGQLAQFPATRGLVDPDHSPVWTAPLSADACAQILRFWRMENPDGSLAWSLHDPDWDTRFLGDLYQDLSEFAKKKYALLQTPVFVEEFILDRTLTPALEQVPLAELKLIDPTCGSGHFLLGAFDRIHDAWLREAPAMDTRERVQKALLAVNGVDINPFAVAIARFRLTLVGLQACGVKRLADAPDLKLRVAVADSLLAGRPKQLEMDFGDDDPDSLLAAHRYSAEDVDDYPGILERVTYHVVVGNPPYIAVDDPALSEAYRHRYDYCYREYQLTVPFLELFFALAQDGRRGIAGWVGQITSNAFMKREFGRKVVEGLLAGRDPALPVALLAVIDTSGAYIPGHGTPTLILIGRRQIPSSPGVKTALGVKGEPGQPSDPARGLVWSEIASHVDDLEPYEGTYVSVVEAPRERFASFPWSLTGGESTRLLASLNDCEATLASTVELIGYTGQTNADPVFIAPAAAWQRARVERELHRPLVIGEIVRDFEIEEGADAFFPYSHDALLNIEGFTGAYRRMWPYRSVTWNRATFSKLPYRLDGRTWWEWHQVALGRLRTPLSIAYAEVATHNHFVLDRGGKVFKQTAPVIKLPAGASEDEHLALLGVLNSSVACFWLKQVSHKKGGSPESGGGEANQPWSWSFQFNATKLGPFPLPDALPLAYGRTLDTLAQGLQSRLPSAVCATGIPSRQRLDEARREYDRIRAEMIAWQEELDWHCYRLYGLLGEDLTISEPPPIASGERAFAIRMAQEVSDGSLETRWFEHSKHLFNKVTEIPSHWPIEYADLVRRRLHLIGSDPNVNLLERPEFKRRWESESWDAMTKKALTEYVLDRLENPDLWARPMTAAQIADAVRSDEGIQSALDLLYGANADRVKAIGALMADEAVPYLAAYRYKPSGMTKRAEWEQVWDLQRREDAGETVDIPVPPKYAQADFRKATYWKARGKLDVPKERFISYPDAGRANDPTALYGWAGWDHGQQAQALGEIVVGRQDREGWDSTRVIPLVAGLVELEPWLHQWHADIDPEYGTSLAEEMTALIDQRLAACGITRDEARAWRPAEQPRGRRSAS